jgi:glycosyltransferase involved in cell wall biosynthesis
MKAFKALRKRLNNGFLRIGPLSIGRTSRVAELGAKLQLVQSRSGQHGRLKRAAKGLHRSVVLVNNSYYNFYYLAAALRKRGWDALSVSIEDPNGPSAKFCHGADLCLYDADPTKMYRLIADFLVEVESRFRMIHFYGKGHLTLLPSEIDTNDIFDRLPFDVIRLKQAGLKIGYSVCGCLDGVAQTTVFQWSGCCERCVWQENPRICSDRGNLAWGHKVHMLCDLIATEGFPALDYQKGKKKVFREPLTTALDPNFWRPDLDVPENYRFKRSPKEKIVFHAVGNYGIRSQRGRNLKGTPAMESAIDRLRSEGANIRLEFATDIPNTELRFLQVQADIIVDQLNYGRYGATAREGMMLGRPTICFINKNEPTEEDRLVSIETCPLVSANEATIYDVLRELLDDDEKRARIGRVSREFAMKWHSADTCAQRFEGVYDSLFQAAELA